jgi:hypothetical protein
MIQLVLHKMYKMKTKLTKKEIIEEVFIAILVFMIYGTMLFLAFKCMYN